MLKTVFKLQLYSVSGWMKSLHPVKHIKQQVGLLDGQNSKDRRVLVTNYFGKTQKP